MEMFYSNIKCGIVLNLLCLFFGCTDTQCSNANTFGPNCDFACHCINNEQCNRTTGICSSGCDFRWAGPACQHKNIVPAGSGETLNMVPRQTGSYAGKYAINAVDTSVSTCSSTTNANQSLEIPWWRVWLNSKYKIRHISILTSNNYLVYFKQFQVMVENNTATYDGEAFDNQHHCYQHNDSVPQSRFIEVKCSKALYGNQIRILLATEETQLVLCDVRIYGNCEDGAYGESCTNKCSPHCDDICDKDNGICAKCENGWTGSYCSQMVCDDGRYGDDCTFNCSVHCRNNAPCRKSDGVCVDGCSPGYRGETCDQTCEDGKYGDRCENSCIPFCRNNSICSKINGDCLSGCSPGYRGQKCNETCQSGSYGIDCKNNCSNNCFQKTLDYCSHVNGSCVLGCEAGFQGSLCNEKCSLKKWGMNCNQYCGSCSDRDSCDIKNGSCPNGCMPGYKTTDMCKEECESGSYDYNCKETCSIYCGEKNNCSRTDGTCANCVAGWTGDKCDTECDDGFYGTGCTLLCGNCKLETICYKTNGVCGEGCTAGFSGEICKAECQDGLYGENCSLQCGNCKLGTVCNRINGVCQEGCSDGFTGEMCDAGGIVFNLLV